jgi:arylsulfatase A
MRFDAAHANPLCTPSRVKLMTGRYNLRNYVQFEHLAAGETTFAHVLSEAGYHTMVAGKWQLAEAGGQTPEDAGFDEHRVWHLNGKGSRYEDPLLTTNGVATDHVGSYGPDLFAEYINDFMKEHRDEPFLVYYPMVIPHGPHVPPPGYDDGGSDQANFKLMVEYMDDIVGRITGTLDALGLREKTLILFLGDNGTHTSLVSYLEDDAIAGGKGLTTDAGTRVPFIASWPGEVPRGSSNNDIVDLSVVLPTLAEAAGAAAYLPDHIDGASILDRLKGLASDPSGLIYVYYRPNRGSADLRFAEFARSLQFKLYATGEFFDISTDPLEESPIALGTGGASADAARDELRAYIDSIRQADPMAVE